MKIACVDKTIADTLRTSYYVIPRFQRPYSWEKDNVQDFWKDIAESGGEDYFIGSMVVYKVSPGNDLYIIDGQQRLTTITIFLSLIRDKFKENGFDNLATAIQNLVQRTDIDAKERYILNTETSFPFFQEYIQKMGQPKIDIKPSPEERLLKQAYEALEENLDISIQSIKDKYIDMELRQNKIKEFLTQIRDSLVALKVIVVELDSEEDAYTVFETLNTRGKDLVLSDLVKNYISKSVKPEVGVDHFAIKWGEIKENIEDKLSDLSLSDFIYHFWLSKEGMTTQNKLFKAIKTHQIYSGNKEALLEDLLNDSRLYKLIVSPELKNWNKDEIGIYQSLLALRLFRVRQQLPMVLSLIRKFKQQKISLSMCIQALNAIESFHFSYNAISSKRSSGGISGMYSSFAKKLSSAIDKNDSHRVIREFIEKLRGTLPKYDEFSVSFLKLKYSNSNNKNSQLIKYILSKIDRIKRKKKVAIDYEKTNLEHISPQNPKDPKMKLSNYDSIGNLILCDTETNSKLGNKDFSTKKPVLIESGIWMDDIINSAEIWKEENISERAKVLCEVAFNEVWKV